MRKNIVAGNWKMNKTYAEAQELMAQLLEYKKNNTTNCEVFIAPPALYLASAKEVFKNGEVGVYAQDVSEYASGAYTGEISVDMLASIDADGSLVSHSERRTFHGETDSHAKNPVLSFGPKSGEAEHGEKKRRLFEQSEFLRFRRAKLRSRSETADGGFSFCYLFLFAAKKKK